MRLPIRAAIATALLALGAEAGYATTPRQVTDRAGDSKPGFADIKSASEQLSSQFDVWTVVGYQTFTTLHAPCIDVMTVHPNGIEWPICGNAAGGFGILTSKPYPAGGGYAGKASVSRPNSSTIVYRVPRKTFDLTGTSLRPKPLGVTWQAQVRGYPTCYPTACDSAPDRARVSFQP
jgi:hypothetical protein